MIDLKSASYSIGVIDGWVESAPEDQPTPQEVKDAIAIVDQALKQVMKEQSELQLKIAAVKLYVEAL